MHSWEVLTSSNKNNCAQFSWEKSKMTVLGISIFWEYTTKHLKSNFFLAVAVVLESKGLSFSTEQLSGPTFIEGFMQLMRTFQVNNVVLWEL